MYTVPGYFDGSIVRPLASMKAKPNQRVLITVTDAFVEPEAVTAKRSMRGILARYADPALRAGEESAWEHAAAEEHAHL